MPASPDIKNYYIGKGIVSIMLEGESTWRDVGNVTVFEFTPTITKLDHFSSRQGVKVKDRQVVTEKGGTLKMTMEEFTAENLALALLGIQSVNSAGQDEIDIFAASEVRAKVKFVGTNDVGPQWQLIYNQVDFVPDAAINPISDDWGNLQVTGDVQVDSTGSFGLATKIADEA